MSLYLWVMPHKHSKGVSETLSELYAINQYFRITKHISELPGLEWHGVLI